MGHEEPAKEPEASDEVANEDSLASTDSQPTAFKLRLIKPHLLIQRTLSMESEPDQFGYAPRNDWPGVDIQVSKGQRRTALALLDRLFKALEARDIQVKVKTDYQTRGTYAVIGQDETRIWVKETYRKVEHTPTAKELRDKEQWGGRLRKWDDEPTGKLVLEPGGPADLSSEEAVQKLLEKAEADVQERIADLRKRREAAEKQRHEEWLRQKEQQEEKARIEAFHQSAKALKEYSMLMDYIEEVRRFGRVPDNQRREGQSLEEWLRWAEWRARQIHPLG